MRVLIVPVNLPPASAAPYIGTTPSHTMPSPVPGPASHAPAPAQVQEGVPNPSPRYASPSPAEMQRASLQAYNRLTSSAQMALSEVARPVQIPTVGAVTQYSLKWLQGDLQQSARQDRIENTISALIGSIQRGAMQRLGTDEAGADHYQVGNLPGNAQPAAAKLTFQPVPSALHIKHLSEVEIHHVGRAFKYQCPVRQFKGESYALASLGGNLFVKSLEPLNLTPRSSLPEFQARTPEANQRLAVELFERAKAHMLEHDSARVRALQDHTSSLIRAFKSDRSNADHRKISEALQTYADYDMGFHVLMNAANQGFSSAEAFFQEAYPQRCVEDGEDTTDDCIEDFMDSYHNFEERSVDDLKAIYHDELKTCANVLFDFVSRGASLQGTTLAHAIKNKTPHAREALSALIEGKPICFDGFLSSSADLDLLMEFAGCDTLPDRADTVVDTRDRSALALEIKHNLLKEVDEADEKQWGRSYITFIGKCGNTKGVFLDSGTTNGKDEDEVLQNAGKVLVPQQILRMHEEATGDRHYIVLGQIEPLAP